MAAMDDKDKIKMIVEASSTSFDKAAQYDNAVVGLGYVGFFALWSVVANKVPGWAALGTASLIGASMSLYVGWVILQMMARHVSSVDQLAAIERGFESPAFLRDWDASVYKSQRIQARLLRVWKPIFYASLSLGLLGAGLLAGTSGVVAVSKLMQQPSKSYARSRTPLLPHRDGKSVVVGPHRPQETGSRKAR